MHAPRIVTGIALAGLACLGTGASGQGPAPQAGPTAQVAVDFTAVTRDGRQADALTPADVSVRIAGRTRAVRSLQRIAVATETGAASPRLPPPYGTNTGSDAAGRTLVLVVDTDSFIAGREMPLRESAREMIAWLARGDRLGLVTVPYGGTQVPPTTDHERVGTALSRLAGRGDAAQSGSELACRTGRTLESLTGYFDALGVRDTPMTVMFVTGGLAAPRRDAPVTRPPGRCELRTDVFHELARAAGAARAQFYIIQPGDIVGSAGTVQRENIAGTGFIGSDNPVEGLEHLAGATGGKMLALTGAAGGAFARVLDETTAYYVAFIDDDRADRSGRAQPIEIRVTRPGVEVRARPFVAFGRPEPSAKRTDAPTPRDMLSSGELFRDLPLRAGAYSALEPEGGMSRVIALAEPVDASGSLTAVMAALFDADGKPVAQWTATPEELQRRPVAGAMRAAPGTYRLRVAAVDETGRTGAVDHEVRVEVLQTGPLKLSSLVLGLSREGRFVPKMHFGSEPVAIAYLEMQGAAPGTRIATALEIARTPDGAPLATVPLAIEPGGQNRYTARGAVPIGALPPGDYVVRALVTVEGQPVTRVVQTLRKGS